MSRDLKQIISSLQNFEVSHDAVLVREALRRLLVLGNNGCDLSSALPLVIKVLPAHDIILKKLSCLLLMRYGVKMPDVILMTHNTIRQEFQDPNPLLRSITLKTACHLRAENYEQILASGLNDDSAQVRRAAVLSCPRLHKHEDSGWKSATVEELYAKLRDDDPLVVTNCLVALEEMLQDEQGVAINRNIFNYLLSQINTFTEWGQMQVLKIVRRYKPKSEAELFDVLNVLDPLFQSKNSGVLVENFRLFQHFLSEDNPQLVKSALLRACISLKRFLNSEEPELSYLILQFIQDEVLGVSTDENSEDHHREDMIQCLLPSLLCKHGESSCIKAKKMQILSQLVNDVNFHQIFEDVCVNLTDFDVELSSAAVRAVGKMAEKLNADLFQCCVSKLFKILDLSCDELISEALWVLQQLQLHRLQDKSILIDKIQLLPYTSLINDESKCSFLWILGEYGEMIPQAPYILEEIVKTYSLDDSLHISVGLVMIVCSLKMFFKRPAECQVILGQVFETCFNQNCQELRGEVAYYYTLLKENVSLCRLCVESLTVNKD